MEYRYLIDIALILFSTKLLGLVTRKFNLPQVVGALLAGLIFGPACLNILHSSELLETFSELGVIVLMFTAGLTTDIKELKSAGKSGFLVALSGVIVPLIMGTAVGFLFNKSQGENTTIHIYQNIFIGVILTATSVSITVEALKELGKFSTKVGNTILAAAIIDDVLGLICLTVVTSLGGNTDVSIPLMLLKIVLFCAFVIVFGFAANKFMGWYAKRLKNKHLQRFPILAFIFCLVFAYCSEEFFGVADITGAFAVGVALSTTQEAPYIENRFRPLEYLLLTPIFFAGIGLKVQITNFNGTILVITIAVCLTAIISKFIGCGIGAKLCGLSAGDSMRVGIGMFCRGEVALIVANKGASMGLMHESFMAPVVIMVVLCAIITPVLLKLSYRGESSYAGMETSKLAERLDVSEQLDAINRQLLDTERRMRGDKEDSERE
ncbi:MAG: cation:proton antiporter [Oscillospiraceae bacterium]|jgi:Kef-type K+ transport system membrane component KefB|nr:cation:proton antiporter [Oscillospiraceae bacterium]